MRKSSVLIIFILIVVTNSLGACKNSHNENQGYHNDIRFISKSYRFPFVSWEIENLSSLMKEKIYGIVNKTDEKELRGQIESIILENGISLFPPLTYVLEDPPHLLVISPRDRIYYFDRILLRQDLSEYEKLTLERKIDELGLSSLVTELGGFGATYPPIVSPNSRINYRINIIVEEWLHQYLAFKPLGFRYFLDSIGIRQDQNIIILNETLAGLVSEEIGTKVINRFYNKIEAEAKELKSTDSSFDIEMRRIRQQVDLYLSVGDVRGAENYMEEQRLDLASRGYKIRKLNQAYFAFHNIYAHDPASISPINAELKKLRSNSVSLKEFLEKASSFRSYADLLRMLN